MLVHDFLTESASRTPDAHAVIEPGEAFTYAQLDREATATAAMLVDAGVGLGDRVVLALDNSFDFIVSYFGILRAGAAAVPLAPGPRSDRLPRAIRDCAPTACIVDEATWPLLRSDSSERSWRTTFVAGRRGEFTPTSDQDGGVDLRQARARARASDSSAPLPAEDGLAAIIYTSGSTGDPMGVMLTHRNITANTRSIVQYLELGPHDRVMVVLPFFYVYGLSLLHTHVAVGGTVVIDNRFLFPNVVLKAMQEHKVTGFAGVPSTFAILLHRSNLTAVSLPTLRYVTQAGGPMPPARIQEWHKALPNVPFFVMYGATEAAARLAYLPPEELFRRQGSIGRAIPDVELRVLREDGHVAAPGEVGEIVARGANISPGYWKAPEATRSRFGPEGYRTGDLGFADADGFLYLVGRKHDMLKVGAHRVSAKEIEEALHEHPAIHEAAVVARFDDLLGEAPVAHVVLREGTAASGAELISFARARLPEHKVPVEVIFHAELPKKASGKIAKDVLRQPAASTIL